MTLEKAGVPDSHGMGHCLTVLDHMHKALQPEYSQITLSEERKLTLQLAALLHDADDRKYFKESQNAYDIINQSFEGGEEMDVVLIREETLKMIDYVSASKNGNKVPEEAYSEPEWLWPRCCDRLEAIGVIGAVRCY